MLKGFSKKLRFFNDTWPTPFVLLRRYPTYLIVSIVRSTSRWTNFNHYILNRFILLQMHLERH